MTKLTLKIKLIVIYFYNSSFLFCSNRNNLTLEFFLCRKTCWIDPVLNMKLNCLACKYYPRLNFKIILCWFITVLTILINIHRKLRFVIYYFVIIFIVKWLPGKNRNLISTKSLYSGCQFISSFLCSSL